MDTSTFGPIYAAGVKALTGNQEWLKERNNVYKERRDLVVDGLRSAGFTLENPKAAIYVWAKLPEGEKDSIGFCARMLEETGCDAVMIGRAAKANPWIFSWRDRDEVSIQEVAETTLWQLKDMLATDPENAIMPFRKYLKAYLEPYQLQRETVRTLLPAAMPANF